jgi:DNA polymerase III subunit delta'
VLRFKRMVTQKAEIESKFLWEICGHESLVGYLKSSIAKGNLSHAYIFAGVDGLGKRAVADKFIQSLYCQGQGEYKPCGECSACRQIRQQSHPDIFYVHRVINEKTGKLYREIVIDQIRDLKFKLSQGTLLSSWKVALIEEAELLNLASANSLLKVLEEPTKKTIIILLTNDLSAIIKTVTSRCQTLNFLPVSSAQVNEFLMAKFSLNEDKASKIAKLALGKPGLAVRLAEDKEYFDQTLRDVSGLYRLLKSSLAERFKALDELVSWEKDESLNILKLNSLLDNWQVGLREIVLGRQGAASGLLASELPDLPTGRCLKVYEMIREFKLKTEYNISSKNILENLIINI